MSKTLQRQRILEVRNWVIFMIIIVRLFYHLKERLVGAACRAQNLDFVPISVESLGGFTPTAIKVIRKLATQKAQRNNSDVKRTINQEFKKLNILLMRGNASLLLNRFQADSVPQEEILEDL